MGLGSGLSLGGSEGREDTGGQLVRWLGDWEMDFWQSGTRDDGALRLDQTTLH